MCQLTVVNLKDKNLNAVLGTFLANINSLQNRDGFGAIVNGTVYKSEFAGCELTNLLEIFSTDKKILIHVRRASRNNVNRENKQHPFKAGEYLLMHNGSLTPLAKNIPDTMIDSEFFASELGKANGKTIVDKLSNTISYFFGKFAFLIYDTKTSKSYAVRDRIAELHFVRVNDGYIINTEKDTLSAALILAKNFYPDLAIGEIKLLDSETVYLLGDSDIKAIGKIKETLSNYNKSYEWYQYRYKSQYQSNSPFRFNNIYELELLLLGYYKRFSRSPFEASVEELQAYINGGL